MRKRVLIIGVDLYDYNRNRTVVRALRSVMETIEIEIPKRTIYGKYLCLKAVISHRDVDYIVALYNAVWIAPILLLLRPFITATVIYDAFISIYDSWVFDRQLVSSASPKRWYYYMLDFLACRSGHILWFETPEMRQYFFDTFHLSSGKDSCVVPISVDFEEIGILARRAVTTNPYPPGNVLHVLFFGNFIPVHGTEYIAAAAHLTEDLPLHVTFVGGGQDKQKVHRLIEEFSLTNVTCREWMPFEELASFIYHADVTLATFGSSKKSGRVVSNKLVESIAFGTPVITGQNPACERYFTDRYNILFCDRADAESLASVLRYAIEHKRELKNMGKRAQEVARQSLSKRALERLFQDSLVTYE